jgi:hypothetical protein
MPEILATEISRGLHHTSYHDVDQHPAIIPMASKVSGENASRMSVLSRGWFERQEMADPFKGAAKTVQSKPGLPRKAFLAYQVTKQLSDSTKTGGSPQET